MHRNYAEHYLKKGDLTNRDINHILSRFNRAKATAFDAKYADSLYEEYKSNVIDDSADREALKNKLKDRHVLVVAPGTTINSHKEAINKFIEKEKTVVISINFIPENINADFVFFSNNKRYYRFSNIDCKTILTSNIRDGKADYTIDYNSVSGAFNQGCNSLILLLKLLSDMQCKSISIAGADGYTEKGDNYYSNSIRSYSEHGNNFNVAVSEAIKNIGVAVNFITPSKYDLGRQI